MTTPKRALGLALLYFSYNLDLRGTRVVSLQIAQAGARTKTVTEGQKVIAGLQPRAFSGSLRRSPLQLAARLAEASLALDLRVPGLLRQPPRPPRRPRPAPVRPPHPFGPAALQLSPVAVPVCREGREVGVGRKDRLEDILCVRARAVTASARPIRVEQRAPGAYVACSPIV